MYEWALGIGLPKAYVITMLLALTVLPALVFLQFVISRKGIVAGLINAIIMAVLVLVFGGLIGVFLRLL